MKKKILKCFVAMRIGEKDTDAAYKKLVRPALSQIGIEARHVDDEEHNEDIDNRIIKLLNQRDLVIADLTYARPSVYFEAGYAEAKDKPVVYTCRRDHFRGLRHELYGELKIHFDLQMKNIIPWTGPEDRAFAKRLKKRVNKVIRPILAERSQDLRHEMEEEQFLRLPLRTKLARIETICRKAAGANGFRGTGTEDTPIYKWLRLGKPERPKDPSMESLIDRMQTMAWFGTKQRAGVLYSLYFVVLPSFAKSNMVRLYDDALYAPVCNVARLVNSKMKQRELREHFIICSLGRTDLAKFSSMLSKYSFQRDGRRASHSSYIEIPFGRHSKYRQIFALSSDTFVGNKDKKLYYIESLIGDRLPFMEKVRHHVTVSAIDSIKSESDLNRRLEKSLRFS